MFDIFQNSDPESQLLNSSTLSRSANYSTILLKDTNEKQVGYFRSDGSAVRYSFGEEHSSHQEARKSISDSFWRNVETIKTSMASRFFGRRHRNIQRKRRDRVITLMAKDFFNFFSGLTSKEKVPSQVPSVAKEVTETTSLLGRNEITKRYDST